VFDEYKKDCLLIEKNKLEKWSLIRWFLNNNEDLINQYEFFWFPDDDLMIDCDSINSLFEIQKKYELLLSQPAAAGYTSHSITHKRDGRILTFTNFVEIMCPLMSKNCLNTLKDSFGINQSGWGLDFLWTKLLGNPTDKIAIIDDIVCTHTKPVGGTYHNRFSKNPMDEMNEIFAKYNISFNQQEYKFILK
jgi:hypothetical protein